jgi:hypothetical protein
MTIQAQVSVYPQVFVPRDYDVFGGLDVDHHNIAESTNWGQAFDSAILRLGRCGAN